MASARKRARPPLLDAKGWVPKRPKREAATWVGRDGARREQRFERCILNATMAAVCPPSHSAATPANVSAQDRRRLLPAGAKYDPVQLSGRDAKAVGAVVAKLLKKVVANVEKDARRSFFDAERKCSTFASSSSRLRVEFLTPSKFVARSFTMRSPVAGAAALRFTACRRFLSSARHSGHCGLKVSNRRPLVSSEHPLDLAVRNAPCEATCTSARRRR